MPADALPKLEACPFCGGKAVKGVCAVWCDSCGVEMQMDDDISDAIAAWNKRSDQKIRDAKAEGMTEAAEMLSMRDGPALFERERLLARARAIRGGE